MSSLSLQAIRDSLPAVLRFHNIFEVFFELVYSIALPVLTNVL